MAQLLHNGQDVIPSVRILIRDKLQLSLGQFKMLSLIQPDFFAVFKLVKKRFIFAKTNILESVLYLLSLVVVSVEVLGVIQVAWVNIKDWNSSFLVNLCWGFGGT